ncbi:MAG: dTDP-4-dehydrorhamnose reductase [Candidatus Polarisedimenticolia bacterium]
MTERPLVLGSNGRLGRALQDVIEDEYADRLGETIFATRDEIDITDQWRVAAEIERIAPTVVINCAAYAQVDACETKRELATLVNAEAAGHIARAAAAAGARLIHISTDLVFDGALADSGRLYREDDEPNPLSHYAASKLEGERAVMGEHPGALVLRSSWFFGPWPSTRFPESFLLGLARGEGFRMVADRLGSPTYLRDLARAVARLVDVRYEGILHFANTGEPTSRYHVLRALAELLGIPVARLQPLPGELWTEDVAPRPAFSALDPSRYAELTGHRPRPWSETLEEYVSERGA